MISFEFSSLIDHERQEEIKEHFEEENLKAEISCNCTSARLHAFIFPENGQDPFVRKWVGRIRFLCCNKSLKLKNV